MILILTAIIIAMAIAYHRYRVRILIEDLDRVERENEVNHNVMLKMQKELDKFRSEPVDLFDAKQRINALEAANEELNQELEAAKKDADKYKVLSRNCLVELSKTTKKPFKR